ncbi:MAG: hypothetical protein INQ03_14375 [Candidatus Heimdallarchaeota archaeon]|nr:hypothetical protein [Candidatus Heimdallarchaeota archaeon]
MSEFIVDLLSLATWEAIFTTLFFLGLIFTIYIIAGAMSGDDADHDGDGDADLDAEPTAIDLDGDGIADGLDLDGDGVIDVHFDGIDLDADMDFEPVGIDLDGDGVIDGYDLDGDGIIDTDVDGLDLDGDMGDIDTDLDLDGGDLDLDGEFDLHVDVHDIKDVAAFRDRSLELKSNFMMGNVSVFMLFTGQIGWIYIHELTDLIIAISLLSGYIASKLFAMVIAKYAKTVVVPLVKIVRGDIAEVKYRVSKLKPGLVNVRRRDGVIDPVMAIGAFPHDNFEAGDLGYIIGKKDAFYLITRGRMELEKKIEKKALDTLD